MTIERGRLADLESSNAALVAELAGRLRELQSQEEELRFALEAGRFGAWRLDLGSGEMTTSATCRKNFGRDPERPFSYAELRDAVHPDDRERMANAVADSIETGADYNIEYRIVTPAGEVRWVAIRARPSLAPDGAPRGISGVSLDITEPKRAECMRQALIDLSDAFRDLDDVAGISYAAGRVLGETLAVDRAGYGTVDPAAETIAIERDWNAAGVESLAGLLRFRDYGSYIEDLVRGETVAFADAETDPRTAATADALKAIRAQAVVNMPVVEQGETVALFYLNHGSARPWRDDEIAFLREVAQRTRVAVERCRAEMALRASAGRLSFLDALGRETAEATDADTILRITTRRLGEHLGVSVCAYADMDDDEDGFTIRGDWAAPEAASIVGHYRLADFGALAVAELGSGLPLVLNDAQRELPSDEAATFRSLGLAATICLPLVKEGRLTALMAVYDKLPRNWRGDELALLREVTERSWAHVERVGATAELQASEARLRALNAELERRVVERTLERSRIWQVSPELLGVIDGSGRFVETNPAWQSLLGWSAEQIAAGPFTEMVHEDDLAATLAAFADLARRGLSVTRFENRYRKKGGGHLWLSWVAAPDEGRIYCSARDVTQRKAQAEELAARTAERDRLWQNSQDILIVIGRNQGEVRAANPAFSSVLGWPPEDVIGRTIFDFIHPDDMPRAGLALANPRTDELPVFENRCRHRDGGWRWLSWTATPKGELIYATARHVTEQKEAAEALGRSQARLRTMFETSFQLQGLLAPDGAMLDANGRFLEVIGQPFDAVAGCPLWEMPWFAATPGMPETVRAAVAAAANGESMRREIELQGATGLRTYDFSLRPMRDEEGAVIGVIPEAVDITDRLARENELLAVEASLRQSQKMEAVGQLTGGLAHDFNNLLAGISGNIQLMQARVAQGRMESLDRYLASALGAVKRAAALTHRLLAFSRRQTLDPKPTNVNRLIAGMEELVRRTVGPGVHLEVVGTTGVWPTFVDPNQLENALLNLCINARDAMPDGGRLTIETANKWMDERAAKKQDLPPGQYVSLCVTDTGAGMAPEVAAKAFDPFFTTKPLGAGTGLGLSMVYGFARQSGGQVRIYSEVGQGTTMCIYLPRHDEESPAEQGPQPRAAPEPRGHGEAVLVIDDEPTIRMLVGEVLAEAGYGAIEAADGAAGLEVLQGPARIDLLITDVGLPGGLNGRQVADAARVVRPGLKILFITGYAENAVVGNGLLERGMSVITKPFEMDALASKIRELIEEA